MPLRFSRAAVLAGVLVAVSLSVIVLARQGAQPTVPPASQAGAAAMTTLNDQVDLSLTVYNSDLALIRDVRQIALAAGTSTLRFADVAARINPATVHFRSLTEPAALSVLEQNYEYDLLDPEKLLQLAQHIARNLMMMRFDAFAQF